jgi:hypothetical protein
MNNQLEKGKYSIEEETISFESTAEKKPKQVFHFELKDSTDTLFGIDFAKKQNGCKTL